MGLLRTTTPSSIDIRTSIMEETGPIEADPTQMHQVLLNLFTNSIHSIRQNGVIGIELSQADIQNGNRTDGLVPEKYVRPVIVDR